MSAPLKPLLQPQSYNSSFKPISPLSLNNTNNNINNDKLSSNSYQHNNLHAGNDGSNSSTAGHNLLFPTIVDINKQCMCHTVHYQQVFYNLFCYNI